MGERKNEAPGIHRVRVLGLWFGGFLAGAYGWQLLLALDEGASLVMPVLGLITGIVITFALGSALVRRHRHHE